MTPMQTTPVNPFHRPKNAPRRLFEPAIVKRAAVEFFNCFGCAFFRFHLDKTESFGLAAEFILDDRRGDHFSRFGKIGFQVIACDLIRQIADV